MKEFDLEKAKAGAPVCTREGLPARIICWDRKDDYYPILALVERNNKEILISATEKGHVFDDERCSNGDLFMTSVKHEGWVNIHKDEYGMPETTERIWKSEESARNAANGDESYIATAKIEWEK